MGFGSERLIITLLAVDNQNHASYGKKFLRVRFFFYENCDILSKSLEKFAFSQSVLKEKIGQIEVILTHNYFDLSRVFYIHQIFTNSQLSGRIFNHFQFENKILCNIILSAYTMDKP